MRLEVKSGWYNMKFGFFFKHIIRDLKSGELTLLSLISFIVVLGMSATFLLTSGVRSSIQNTAGTLLGADKVISSPLPIVDALPHLAQKFHLKTTSTLTFLSMLVQSETMALAEVKAIDNAFPLKGNLRAFKELGSEKEILSGIPAPGTVWLDPLLFTLLSVKMNDTVMIGAANFLVKGVLAFEPGKAERLMLAPRALINLADVSKTAVIQEGSRETYHLYLAGNEKDLKDFEKAATPILNPSQRFVGSNEGSMKNVFDQAESYIRVILGINFILAMLALSQIAQFFFKKQERSIALLRCLGAPFRWIYYRILFQVGILSIMAGILGFLSALGMVLLVQKKLEKFFYFSLEPVWATSLLISFGLLLILLLISSLPALLNLRTQSPLTILRAQNMPSSVEVSAWAHSLKQFLISILGKKSVGFRYGISNVIRQLGENIIQILAFSLIFMGIATIWILKTELMQIWHKEIPRDAPNYFVINIGKEEVGTFKKALQGENIQDQGLYPIVRGRLLSKPEMQRLLNITYSDILPKDNKVVAGQWFTVEDRGKALISVEQGFAERMQIHLGDNLLFQFADKSISAKVSSIRTADWNSLHPNFFVIFPTKMLENIPSTFMTSFYLPPEKLSFLKLLIQNFPAISLIDISTLLQYLAQIISIVTLALEYLFFFTLIMAMLFFLSSISVTLDERKKTAIIFRALGVDNNHLFKILLSEFLILGILSGILAVLGATGLYAWLMKSIFKLPFEWPYIMMLVGPIIITLFIMMMGFFGVRQTFRVSPAQILSSRTGY